MQLPISTLHTDTGENFDYLKPLTALLYNFLFYYFRVFAEKFQGSGGLGDSCLTIKRCQNLMNAD